MKSTHVQENKVIFLDAESAVHKSLLSCIAAECDMQYITYEVSVYTNQSLRTGDEILFEVIPKNV